MSMCSALLRRRRSSTRTSGGNFVRYEGCVATPAFHHWHHSAEREAVDKNFAVHTPIWDILFGTFYLPDRWPEAYGLYERDSVPSRWTTQLIYPFRGKRLINAFAFRNHGRSRRRI